ncbi:unnamed protein product, partial [Diatraea saccharalis]
QASSKIFHSTLKSIQSKVEAVVNIKYEDDDVVEIVNGPAKVEKTMKKETVAEEKPETKKVNEKEKLEEFKGKGSGSETKTEITKDKECDITTSENMDIDDKE